MVGLAIRSESIDHFIIILQQRTLPTSIHPYTLQPPFRSEAARCRLGRRIIAGHGMRQLVLLYRPLHCCPHDLGISLNIYISEFGNMAPHHMLLRVSKCFPIRRPPPLSVSPSVPTVALQSSPPLPPSLLIPVASSFFSFLTPNILMMAIYRNKLCIGNTESLFFSSILFIN